MSESLRDALEKIALNEAGDSPAAFAQQALMDQPAEPVGVSDEAVEVVAETFARTSSGGLWGQYTELTRQLVISNAKPTARAALEAAAPLMGATLRPTREQIAEALLVELKRQGADEFFYPGKLADDLAAAVLALMGGADNG